MHEIFLNLGEAIDKLGEILSKTPTDDTTYIKEVTIRRFKISVELFCKLLKKICQSEGIETTSPKSILQKSFSIKLVEDEMAWLDMLEDHNLTPHMYRQPLINRIHSHCAKYYTIMDTTYQNLKNFIGFLNSVFISRSTIPTLTTGLFNSVCLFLDR